MSIPTDYVDRVYAGVLGKIIGVYLGRPFEGWTYEKILRELGEITYYVNDRMGKPLIVADDDISGTFAFLRALSDFGNGRNITAEQIGQTWLNYIIEGLTILWWGVMGNSTEHTAFIRLKSGIPAPKSGSIALNGTTVAEQIGAQIFIDGWGMVAPGDPELAGELARKAASVSHDGVAVDAAQVIAAIEAISFVEQDMTAVLDSAVRIIPSTSTIRRVIDDIREWHEQVQDWKSARRLVEERYGYDKYPGHVHVVPNHAVVILALLYGNEDFHTSLSIANTCGWDTDCNSGNVGCILGIKNGLGGLAGGPDWRGPVADRMYISTAEGGHTITDAAVEAYRIVSIGRALSGEPNPKRPKGGARFHFELPGSVQGFRVEESADAAPKAWIENVEGHSTSGGRCLAVRLNLSSPGETARISTPTFILPDALSVPGYGLVASPTLYPGQSLRMRIEADRINLGHVTVAPLVKHYGAQDAAVVRRGPGRELSPGDSTELTWQIEETDGQPIFEVGVEVGGDRAGADTVFLDYLSWDGSPEVRFCRPSSQAEVWSRAWVDAVDHYDTRWREAFHLSQDRGIGLLITGSREWGNYRVETTLTAVMAAEFGIAARVQGLHRYYALLLSQDGRAQLVRELNGRTVLSVTEFPWSIDLPYHFSLSVRGNRVEAAINGKRLFDVSDGWRALDGGGVALLCTEGCIATNEVVVRPLDA